MAIYDITENTHTELAKLWKVYFWFVLHAFRECCPVAGQFSLCGTFHRRKRKIEHFSYKLIFSRELYWKKIAEEEKNTRQEINADFVTVS